MTRYAKPLQHPEIYVRNYEPAIERCERKMQENQANILERDQFNEKLRGKSNGFRKPMKSKEKHAPIQHGEYDEPARI